jgi:hypothetical protein
MGFNKNLGILRQVVSKDLEIMYFFSKLWKPHEKRVDFIYYELIVRKPHDKLVDVHKISR